jgi:hypothetical protein
MRNTLNEIYFGKTKDIVNDLRFDVVGWFISLFVFYLGVYLLPTYEVGHDESSFMNYDDNGK